MTLRRHKAPSHRTRPAEPCHRGHRITPRSSGGVMASGVERWTPRGVLRPRPGAWGTPHALARHGSKNRGAGGRRRPSSPWTKSPAPADDTRTASSSARLDRRRPGPQQNLRTDEYVVGTHRIEASTRANKGSPRGNEGSSRGNDGGKGQDDVSRVRNDVSVDRSADGARRHLSESRCRAGQRCIPDGGWREYGCSSMRMLYCRTRMAAPTCSKKVEGLCTGFYPVSPCPWAALRPHKRAQASSPDVPTPSVFPRCSGTPRHDAPPSI